MTSCRRACWKLLQALSSGSLVLLLLTTPGNASACPEASVSCHFLGLVYNGDLL